MRFTSILKLVFLLTLSRGVVAQTKFWISNSDEIANQAIEELALNPENCSDWLNRCSYMLTHDQKKILLQNNVAILPVRTFHLARNNNTELLSFALEQIGAEHFIDAGLNGSGVKIGIIDGGFLNADKNETLAHLFSNNHVKYYKDYITPELSPYDGLAMLDDAHGTEVWQLIGGQNPSKKIQFGLATASDYFLARTDHGGYEKRLEEDYIIAALEAMAEMGVKLFNISLGYTMDYTDPKENYTVNDVDGQTSMLTLALDRAAVERGLLFVISAGNDGDQKWQTLSIPADAHHVLTVGASKFKLYDKMDFSSIGSTSLPYMKPNISIYSTLGTSFSAPIITGLAACIMQYDSTLTNLEIMDVVEKSSNFYPYGNNYLGHGVPDCKKILALLAGKTISPPKLISSTKNRVVIDDVEDKTVVLFHKNDTWIVKERILVKSKKDRLTVKRPKGISRTSILVGKAVTEIAWEK